MNDTKYFYAIKYIVLLSFLFAVNTLQSQSKLNSPFDCVTNHLNNLLEKDYNPKQASKSFYVPNEKTSIEYAIKLKKIFDGKGLIVNFDLLSDNPEYIDSLTGKSRYVIFPAKLPEIYLEKIDDGWYYSTNCYVDIELLYKEIYPFGDDLLYKLLSPIGNGKTLGLYHWQYLAFLIVMILAVLLYFLLRLLFKPIFVLIVDKSFNTHLDLPKKYGKVAKIFSLIIVFYFLRYSFALLNLPINLSAVFIVGFDIINVLLISAFVFYILDIVMSFFSHLAKGTKSKMDDQVIPIIRQIINLLIFMTALIKILVLLDINVNALIAGISIGGLALALAAQDTVRNFIGSLAIFVDKPFQVEDWIEIDNIAGTVMEVGFRSTRIKQLDTSIISIPNGIISNKALKNKGLRIFRIFETKLGITYDTPRVYIQAFIKGLRIIAENHPKISIQRNIFLSDLGSYSINILFRVYLETDQYEEELRLKEEITFQIMELAEHLNIRFAFPSQTLYIEQFPGQKDLIPQYENLNIDKKLEDFFNNKK